jgi:hypothetical protein
MKEILVIISLQSLALNNSYPNTTKKAESKTLKASHETPTKNIEPKKERKKQGSAESSEHQVFPFFVAFPICSL